VYPNLATYPVGASTGTDIPYTTGYAGTPGPLAGYCGTGGYGSFGPNTVPSRPGSRPGLSPCRRTTSHTSRSTRMAGGS
jgi:hypothetical protein